MITAAEADRLADAWNNALDALARHAAQPGAGGRTPSDLDLVALDQTDIESLEQQHPNIDDIWPLSPLQEGLLFHADYERTGDDPYLVQLVCELEGRLDPVRLHRGLDALLERHATLRVSFQQNRRGDPLQIVHKPCVPPWREEDLSGLTTEDRDNQADTIEIEDRRTRFTLEQAPLIRATLLHLGADRHRLLITQHHLLGDGWSGQVLLEDLLALYRHQGNGSALPLQPAFKDYLAWLQRQNKDAARDAWRAYLAGIEGPTRLAPAIAHNAPVRQVQYEENLSRELTARLETVARQHGLTIATLLQGAWAIVLGRLTNQNDVVFGNVNSGRHAPIPGIERMLGLLIVTTPLRARLDPTERALVFLERLQREQAQLLPHQHLPFAEDARTLGTEDLFDTLFIYENYPVRRTGQPETADELPLRAVRGHDNNHYPLSLAAIPGSELGLCFSYNADLFESALAPELVSRLNRVLEQVAADPQVPLHRLAVLGDEERARVLHTFNATDAPVADATLVARFEQQVAATPDRVALVSAEAALTYAALDARANQLAWHLLAAGVGPETRVALGLPRSLELVVAVLATLKAGAAFVPLDLDAPPARLAALLADARPTRLLTTAARGLAAPAGLALWLDAPDVLATLAAAPVTAPTDTDRPVPLRPAHPAYVLYTSGSTGTPKGVVISHRSLTHYLDLVSRDVLGAHAARMPLFTAPVFDLTLTTLLAPLCGGGQLQILADAHPATALATIFGPAATATAVKLTPSHLALLPAPPAPPTPLALAMVGGEALTAAHVAALQAHGTALRVFNEYGPTETTVGATGAFVETADVHIGRPYPNTRVYILDAALQPCPLGVGGELYLAGVGLARGYWAQPARTAERFVADPYARVPGDRLYRTGDLAAWRADGTLHYHGRADQQVKIRGVRIEPGEIEAALLAVPAIAQAAVIARPGAAGDPHLVAYLVPAETAPGERAPLDLPALRTQLAARLPDYMVPAAFVVLDALPLTPNGKLDRQALPAPAGAGLARAYVAPTTPEEVLLCDLVAALVGVARVGLTDHFFHLGGHSLLAARLAAQIRAQLARELEIRTIFEYPILGELAKRIGLVTDGTTAFELLLPIRRTGSLPPLFCMHPVAGLCWSYANLLSYTDADQPLYGIQARGFADDRALPESLDEVISESLEQIRSVQAQGPYRLFGWSFGGILAHMVATRLQAEGEDVDRLILFDAYPPSPRRDDPSTGAQLADEIWRDLAFATDLTIPAGAPGTMLDANTVFALAREQSHILGALTLRQLEQVAAVMANNARFMPSLQLGRFDGDLHLYTVTRRPSGFDYAAKNPKAWRPFCGGTIRTIAIDSTHNRMLSPEALKQIGRLPLP